MEIIMKNADASHYAIDIRKGFTGFQHKIEWKVNDKSTDSVLIIESPYGEDPFLDEGKFVKSLRKLNGISDAYFTTISSEKGLMPYDIAVRLVKPEQYQMNNGVMLSLNASRYTVARIDKLDNQIVIYKPQPKKSYELGRSYFDVLRKYSYRTEKIIDTVQGGGFFLKKIKEVDTGFQKVSIQSDEIDQIDHTGIIYNVGKESFPVSKEMINTDFYLYTNEIIEIKAEKKGIEIIKE